MSSWKRRRDESHESGIPWAVLPTPTWFAMGAT